MTGWGRPFKRRCTQEKIATLRGKGKNPGNKINLISIERGRRHISGLGCGGCVLGGLAGNSNGVIGEVVWDIISSKKHSEPSLLARKRSLPEKSFRPETSTDIIHTYNGQTNASRKRSLNSRKTTGPCKRERETPLLSQKYFDTGGSQHDDHSFCKWQEAWTTLIPSRRKTLQKEKGKH